MLLSGGLDSATTLAIARDEGLATYALTVDYSQRHAREIESARRVAAALGAAEHLTLEVDRRVFGGSALTGDLPVPKGRSEFQIASGSIPVTYVPARNTLLLAHALAWAETLGASDVFLGVNAVDYSGYPDCRPEFVDAFDRLARLATRSGVEDARPIRIRAPLLELTKSEIVARGMALGVDFGLTWSCYDPTPEGRPCRECDSCRLRRAGFEANGLEDPLDTA